MFCMAHRSLRPVALVSVPLVGALLLTLLLVAPTGAAPTGARYESSTLTKGAPPEPGLAAAATAPATTTTAAAAPAQPAFASRVPDRTRQVVRTVRTRRWCAKRWCSKTQAWRKGDAGRWVKVREFRSTIGP